MWLAVLVDINIGIVEFALYIKENGGVGLCVHLGFKFKCIISRLSDTLGMYIGSAISCQCDIIMYSNLQVKGFERRFKGTGTLT